MKIRDISLELKDRDERTLVVVEVKNDDGTTEYFEISGIRFDGEHRKLVFETEPVTEPEVEPPPTEPVPTPQSNR